jgi:hypothetical protein
MAPDNHLFITVNYGTKMTQGRTSVMQKEGEGKFVRGGDTCGTVSHEFRYSPPLASSHLR